MEREIKFYRIDFLRIVFVYIIIYGHVLQHFILKKYGNIDEYIELKEYYTTIFGLSCEMLFIISGFFFFYTLKKNINLLDFIVKKWIRLAPAVLFSLFVYFLFSKIGWYKFSIGNALLQSMFLPYTGIVPSSAFPYLWYIDAMLWSMVFYFYIIKNFNAKYTNLFIMLIIYFSYLIIIPSSRWYPQDPYINGIFFVYMLRGLSGLGIGYFCAHIYEKFLSLSLSLSLLTRMVVSICELSIFLYTVKALVIHPVASSTAIYLLLFIVLFLLFIMNKGYFSNAVNIKIFSIIGKYGYTTYVMSYITSIFMMNTVWEHKYIGIKEYPMLHIILYIIFTFVISVFVYHGVEKPLAHFLTKIYKIYRS